MLCTWQINSLSLTQLSETETALTAPRRVVREVVGHLGPRSLLYLRSRLGRLQDALTRTTQRVSC